MLSHNYCSSSSYGGDFTVLHMGCRDSISIIYSARHGWLTYNLLFPFSIKSEFGVVNRDQPYVSTVEFNLKILTVPSFDYNSRRSCFDVVLQDVLFEFNAVVIFKSWRGLCSYWFPAFFPFQYLTLLMKLALSYAQLYTSKLTLQESAFQNSDRDLSRYSQTPSIFTMGIVASKLETCFRAVLEMSAKLHHGQDWHLLISIHSHNALDLFFLGGTNKFNNCLKLFTGAIVSLVASFLHGSFGWMFVSHLLTFASFLQRKL